MSHAILQEHRLTWERKPVLRAIYHDFYERISAFCIEGRSLEVGGGSGNLKEYRHDVVTTDIVPTSWLDAVADAQALPFAGESFANIVAVDVLHHIERPVRFLHEAQRVLQPGGRIILVEPAISPVSWFFYRIFHPEPVIMNTDPLAGGELDPQREPFDANQAIPTLLFGRHRKRLEVQFPALRLAHFERFSFFVYPLSGGFRSWSLVPAGWTTALLKVEKQLSFLLGGVMAFRLFAVVEKSGALQPAGATLR
jgi:SAM-dependent methyltransferase